MPYKNKLDQQKSHRKWHLRNRKIILVKQRKYHREIKEKVLLHYGKGRIECACCGEQTKEFLCIDHGGGGGNKHRNQIGKSYTYLWLIKNRFPRGFRILCYNCNQAISIYGKCSHKR